MTESRRRRAPSHPLLLRLASILIGVLVALLLLEGVARLLPVTTGVTARPVTAEQPVFRFEPDQDYLWSLGWNFEAVNRGRTNRQGFVNDQDYEQADPRPLLAVVGDSYVEALMVPYPRTVHGLLASRLGTRARVYSFAASGAPLSQYLVWIRHARDRYRPEGLAIVIVGNDFDESLRRYRTAPGFHQFERDAGGALVLTRNDYHPSGLRRVLRRSALARYLVFNVHADVHVGRLIARLVPEAGAGTPRFVGNTDSRAGEQRMADSRSVVDAFLDSVPGAAGLTPDRVALLIDGLRPQIYQGEEALRAAEGSYFARMREYLIETASQRGFEVIDLNRTFRAAFARDGRRFEFTRDAHWNDRGHAVAARALGQSRVVESVLSAPRER